MLQILQAIFKFFGGTLYAIRWILIALLAIGLPVFIYLTFITKLLAEGQDVRIPEFLSDHPASESRVQAIRQAAREVGCSTELGDRSGWQSVQASLPPLKDDTVETASALDGADAE
jgi:hypothetical protein